MVGGGGVSGAKVGRVRFDGLGTGHAQVQAKSSQTKQHIFANGIESMTNCRVNPQFTC